MRYIKSIIGNGDKMSGIFSCIVLDMNIIITLTNVYILLALPFQLYAQFITVLLASTIFLLKTRIIVFEDIETYDIALIGINFAVLSFFSAVLIK